jgi:hypothetical protein
MAYGGRGRKIMENSARLYLKNKLKQKKKG